LGKITQSSQCAKGLKDMNKEIHVKFAMKLSMLRC